MMETVFLNGRFLPQGEAKLPVFAPGFLYGWGLFETMRSYNNRIICFDEHLKRIQTSSKMIEIKFPYPLHKLKEIIKETVRRNGFLDTYVRLTLWKAIYETDILVVAKKYHSFSLKEYKTGFGACICPFRQNEYSFLAGLKTTNYLLYQLAHTQAKVKGFDEAVILNSRGYIAEGSRSNVFLIKDKEIFTPALECGCLNGITRRVILALAKKYNIKANEGNFTLKDLYEADEVFLTNSLIGVMPLRSIEKQRIRKGTGSPGLTKFFMQKYNHLLKYGL